MSDLVQLQLQREQLRHGVHDAQAAHGDADALLDRRDEAQPHRDRQLEDELRRRLADDLEHGRVDQGRLAFLMSRFRQNAVESNFTSFFNY